MTNYIIAFIYGVITVVLVAGAAFIGTKIALSNIRWKIKIDDAKDQIELTPMKPPTSETVIVQEATESELIEMDKEPAWKKFFKRFVKVK